MLMLTTIRLSTGFPMEELGEGLKELKGFEPHKKNNNINQPEPLELPGTKPPTKEGNHGSSSICSREWPYLALTGGEALDSVRAQCPRVWEGQGRVFGVCGRRRTLIEAWGRRDGIQSLCRGNWEEG